MNQEIVKIEDIVGGANIELNTNKTYDVNSASTDDEYPSALAVQKADELKVDKVSGKGLSTNDYTTTEKNKLAGIAAGAEVNVNADWNAVSGDSQILNKPTLAPSDAEKNIIVGVQKNGTDLTPDVNRKVNVVVPTQPSDVGLSNVDNTADLLKPISTATQTALDLKAMQNPGVCQKIPIQPIDIVIDPVANTLTIATIKGGEAISALNPIRFFTDGAGIITKHEKTAPVVFNFTNTTGVWYFHFDNTGTAIATQTVWTEFNTIATIYRFYLNDQLSNAEKITVRAWEAHLNDTSATDHAWKHAQGTQYVNGFDTVSNILANTSGVPTSAPNADGRNTVVSLTGGKNSDDGLEYTVVNSIVNAKFNQDLGVLTAGTLNATNAALFKIRTNDALGRLSFLPSTRFPFAWDSATNAPQYITANGTRTLVANQRWFVYYAYALQDDKQGEAIKLVSAEVDFTTYTNAQAHRWATLQGLYPTLRDKEIRLLYQFIFYVDKATGATYDVGCKYSALVQINDLRTTVITSIGTVGGGLILATNVIETTDGNVQVAIENLRSGKEPTIGTKGDAFNKSFGSTAGTVMEGNKIASTTNNRLQKWDGSKLVDSGVSEDGNGIINLIGGESGVLKEIFRFNRAANDGFRYNSIFSKSDTEGTASIGILVHDAIDPTSQVNVATFTGMGKTGFGVPLPKSKLDVNGGVKIADDTDAAGVLKAGTMRYRETANNSYWEICVKNGASSYIWKAINTETW